MSVSVASRIDDACRRLGFQDVASPAWTIFVALAECVGRYGIESPAAMGCLLALVRAAWEAPNAYVAFDGQCFMLRGRGGYLIDGHGQRYVAEAKSEILALVLGLEAAQ